MREYKFIPGYENLKGTEVERRCALRDKLNLEEFTKCKVRLNNYGDIDILENKKGKDCQLINKNKVYNLDLKPTLSYDYRSRFIFELEIFYPDNLLTIPGYATNNNITNYLAYTDNNQVVFFNKKLVIQQMKVVKSRYSRAITEIEDKDYNGKNCIKRITYIGYRDLNEIFKNLEPFGYKRVFDTGKAEIRRFTNYNSFISTRLVNKKKIDGRVIKKGVYN